MNIAWIIVLRQQPSLKVLKVIDKIILAQALQKTKRMNRTSEASVVNITHEGDCPSEYKDIGTSSPRTNELISNNAQLNAFVSSAGKACVTGSENGRLLDCVSHEPEEFTSNMAQVEAECEDSNEEPLLDNIERDPEVSENHYLSMTETLESDALLFKNHNDPEELADTIQSKERKLAHFECITDENTDKRMTPLCTHLHPMVEEFPADVQNLDLRSTLRSQHSCFKLSETKNESSDEFTDVTSQPSDEQMRFILPVCHKGQSLIESPTCGNGISLNEKKGLERVLNAGGHKSVLMEKDDSHESAESSNSMEPRAKGKRAWTYGQQTFMGNKRMRKLIDKNLCSGSNVREDSSFMNWISSVTKGFFRSDHVDKHSLGFIPHPVPSTRSNFFSCSRLNDNDHSAACSGMGFGSIFRALYYPRLEKPTKTLGSDYQEEYTEFRKLHFNDRPDERVKADPISSVRNGQHVHQFREPPMAAPSFSLRNSHIREKMKHNMEEYYNLCNVGSSSSSFHHGSSSPSEGKGVSKLGIFEPNNLSNLSIKNKASRSPTSLWIARFSSNVAALTPREKLADDCSKFLHYSQSDGIVSVRDCSNSENAHLSSEDQRPYSSMHLHEYSTTPMDSCGVKEGHTDPKTKLKLNPILPSQAVKRLEPMSSVFVKRLDAFRHIRTTEARDDATPESETCFFCGKNGHSIAACSDVMESELEDLMQKMNSYGWAEKSCCICIRCFMHDHWAIACPYASLSHHHTIRNTCDIKPKNSVHKTKGHRSDAPLISDYAAEMCIKSDDGLGRLLNAHEIPHGEMSGAMTEVKTGINVDILDINNLKGSVLSSCLTKDGYRRAEVKGKQIASASTRVEPIGKPLIRTIDINNKHGKQCLVFERIRKLRLSRTEIIRWMESSISHFSLVGFFLRVRIGKWEEDLGGSEYHVACISGASGVCGYSKHHLPVDIGGLRCLIGYRFISNHDFAKDELRAWWSATLRRGGILPSEEDLDKKLQVREKFDL